MDAVVTDTDKRREKVRAYLRQCYADSLPLLYRTIPLAIPAVEDFEKVRRYYERKHLRTGEGTYFLHQVQRHGFAAGTKNMMRSLRKPRSE